MPVVHTITVPFMKGDEGLFRKAMRLKKKLGVRSSAALLRMGILALWRESASITERMVKK